MGDLKGLLRYVMKGATEPVKELPVPDLPAVLADSVHRVCGSPPDALCTMSHVAAGIIHVFPLSHRRNAGPAGGPSSVTYGLLSKVPSPKEARHSAKQAMENKKSTRVAQAGATADEGEEKKAEEDLVVRVVCHGLGNLSGKEIYHNDGEIHSGRVWVSTLSKDTSKAAQSSAS